MAKFVCLTALVLVLLPTSPAEATSRKLDTYTWREVNGTRCVALNSELNDESAALFTRAVASKLDGYGGTPCAGEGYTDLPGEVRVRTDVYVWNVWANRWELCYAGPWEYTRTDYGVVMTSYWWSHNSPCQSGGWFVINSAAFWWGYGPEGWKPYGGWRATNYMWFNR